MMYEQQSVKRTTYSNDSNSIEETERLEIVNLSGLSLDSLPNPSLELASICKLDLSNNNLQNIPESLTAKLVNTVVLDVHSNQLRTLPNSIGCLSKLKILNVSGNLIQYLPKTLENCRALEDLNLNFNKLIQLPENLGFGLINLKKLSINSNKLLSLPRSISYLISLKNLDARLNCLRSLPEDLENLINLETLNVSQNFHFLDTIPYSIGLLLSLVELDISYNKIKSLPDSIGGLTKLQKLCVEGNPLTSPPPEVMELGLHAVKEYLGNKMNAANQSPTKSPTKKKSWVGRLVKYGTFNVRNAPREEREAFIVSDDDRSIDSVATSRHTGMFSPRRLFSGRNYFSH
ncbi:unnamed protein product [Vicia faba]|uniref:Uncharacterized protein n=1 Tax=Vicia faba TaxID=3906 RepID=A0AAV1AP19_VICFA|nr:unnamed protein product [Vicia faba]